MGYRIIEVTDIATPVSGLLRAPDWLDNAKEIATHDSAYEAMRVMREEFDRILETPSTSGSTSSPAERIPLPNWYLVDPMGEVIASPYDVREAQLDY